MTSHLSPERLPLNGVRIFDLTHVWSGPMATRVLAGLGAEVIKLESPSKPDALRGNASDIRLRYPDLTPGDDSINRNAWFNTQNVDKKGVVLDLKHAEGIELARRLIRMSDVVIANYRPGVLERMGFGFDDLVKINPGIVLVEMPGYTADSPLASAPAFGAQFDAQSGSATLTGGPDRPLLTGFALGDPAAGMMAANAVVSALIRARRTLRPSHVVLAQSEAMMPLLGEYYLAASVGTELEEDINEDRRSHPHGLYRTGDGGWVAIAVETDEQWATLRGLLIETCPSLGRITTGEQRRENSAAIGDALAGLASTFRSAAEAARALQGRGVVAAQLQRGRELCGDPQLAHSGYFTRLSHPSSGTHNYPGLPITIDGCRVGTRRPAPQFNQDTKSALTDLLGLSEARLRELADNGVIGPVDDSTTTQFAKGSA